MFDGPCESSVAGPETLGAIPIHIACRLQFGGIVLATTGQQVLRAVLVLPTAAGVPIAGLE